MGTTEAGTVAGITYPPHATTRPLDITGPQAAQGSGLRVSGRQVQAFAQALARVTARHPVAVTAPAATEGLAGQAGTADRAADNDSPTG